ncbi:arrestin domain-containing protein 1a isoform X2 [Erpetoichthys calabaricus]|uniref:Arrestin domain containing 1 n=1 Tax=Erpetoichthys calabaricus TaxID=27687 RepID=A0A8C4XHB2_ERPCA|nr:arrestin domain-containing protein 1a isoform X2 [Erpetoichthys calabaricus]
MGKLQRFDIAFSDNKVVYSPGELISGTVSVVLNSPLPFKAIKVNCAGSCGVSNKMNETNWTVEEQYFSSTLTMAEKGSLPPGEHCYPFRFPLPVSCPTSFEGPFGRIEYRIRATIDTPRFAKDYKTQKAFYVLNLLNLNEIPDIEQPNTVSTSKKFSYLLVKTGTLTLTAGSDLRGYTPGQVIKLSAAVHNKSGKDSSSILASLIQKVTYKSKRSIYDLRTIAEVEGAGVKGGKNAEWREQIIVPPLPQSTIRSCTLIQIDYFLQVSLKSPEILVTLPIYIGNIAINSLPVTPSRPVRPAPLAPASATVTPTAPPAELACGTDRVEIPTKSHSQQQSSSQPAAFSPSAFSYAPGLSFPETRADCEEGGSTGPLFCVSTGATVPYYSEGAVTPTPTAGPLILPPEYSSWNYPSEPPPSYEESCSRAPRD